ncbi:phage holin [Listeria monocytogenes]|uniref:Lin1702 protein n=1 Tax=Listeria innocua serovar 6a (strain ATCC BAA-680 / CLIP 11262) TaxID=272626 RepID=Q92B48_LISIN|nr:MULTISPECIES: phage holin [Listeria]EIT1175458.1 phage holin [Listeria innocua]EAC3442594.1 phage holin [Listeria monocytogenes]EAC3890984.1 phage holin [Listeria monocytogenes]EAC3956430.1 phage holin [Listeria monocytogenes]EAC4283938.1 phage holin [Listeria monocytogenes]
MKINWKVRMKSKVFWVSVIPLVLVLAQQLLGWFGVTIPADTVNKQALDFVNSVFLLLGVLGVVNDPTTEGTADSELVLNRNRKDEE